MNPVHDASEDPQNAGWFDEAYAAHFDYVWHAVRRLGGRPADVEDLVHDIFVILYRTRARLDRSRPLRPWIFGITVRKLSDYRRQARRYHRNWSSADENARWYSPRSRHYPIRSASSS